MPAVRALAVPVSAILIGAASVACHQKPACCAAPPPPPPINFNDYRSVNTDDYHTYSTYGWNGIQFSTRAGIRCRIYDGPHSFQYAAAIDCWGPLPGVASGVNYAKVSEWPYDKDTLTPITRGPAPPGHTEVFSLFSHTDLNEQETYHAGPTEKRTVDPASYHLLNPGQKIVVPGGHPGDDDLNTSICAVVTDDSITCEIQNLDHAGAHGFRILPQGSQTY
ncbi:hypothetical protein BRW65_26695 [Mycobacterium paraffinicum]|uniref:Uncharacterized protein n=1 Tax=Mycobacterium paraffinicum TaxID=53378 RepID=A0A1Q4HGX7_9MYCO|nr:hypothetical protein [Mycobacterium paraffinicum]OJZ66809.1 hypothetical protein BRW65_26695 [Mycobacterium paraffinicum]